MIYPRVVVELRKLNNILGMTFIYLGKVLEIYDLHYVEYILKTFTQLLRTVVSSQFIIIQGQCSIIIVTETLISQPQLTTTTRIRRNI